MVRGLLQHKNKVDQLKQASNHLLHPDTHNALTSGTYSLLDRTCSLLVRTRYSYNSLS